MRQKISKLAKELNVSVSTAVEFLRKNGVEVEDNLNARIDESAVALLHKEFRKDASVKATVDMQRSEKRAAAAKDRAAEIAAAKAEEEARKAEAKRLEAERKARAEAEEAQRKAAIEKARAEEAARKAAEAKAEAERKAAQEAKAKAEAEAKAAREIELKAAQAGKHPEMKDNSDKQSANNDAPRTASPADTVFWRSSI